MTMPSQHLIQRLLQSLTRRLIAHWPSRLAVDLLGTLGLLILLRLSGLPDFVQGLIIGASLTMDLATPLIVLATRRGKRPVAVPAPHNAP